MSLSYEKILKISTNEVFVYRNAFITLFVVISLIILGISTVLPKSYTSSTSIFINEGNIIDPLLAGTAVTTSVRERVGLAREIIFSRRIMNEILVIGEWIEDDPEPIEQERIVDDIKKRIEIRSIGQNLLKISYTGTKPQRVYEVTKAITGLFIEESLTAKENESQEAFNFINNQVKEYQDKLSTVEMQLEEYRNENEDVRTGSEGAVSARIDRILSTIDQTSLLLKEAQIRQASIERQLSGEAESTISLSREGQLKTRIGELLAEMDRLRLSYHDSYPDIVAMKQQIENLRIAVKKEKEKRAKAKKGGAIFVDEGVSTNPLYQQLRRELSQVKTEIATITGRLKESRRLLQLDMERSRRIHSGEKVITELTRDYQVNRDIYQDLLRRRENARVSMNLNKNQQSVAFKIQEHAIVPIQPSGFRFLHFVILGIVLGIAVPLGLIYMLVTVDPNIRDELVLSSTLQIPVIGVVAQYRDQKEEGEIVNNIRILTAVVATVAAIYISVITMRISGVF